MFPLSDTKTSGKFPFWVVVFILVNCYVFILELVSPNLDAFVVQYSLIPAKVNFFEIRSLTAFITSQFLHGGFVHIISNMWFLWVFGDNVEGRLGFFLFPLLYIISGIFGGLVQYLLDPASSVPMLGASGAIAGVLGAYLGLFPHNTIKTLVPVFGFLTVVNVPAYFLLFLWFVTQLFNGSASIVADTASLGGVAFFAHVGGFAVGWVISKKVRPV